jgi:hypothetical protein
MLETFTAFSLIVFSAILFSLSSWAWLPVWRVGRRGTAHGLFLTNAALSIAAIAKMFQIVYWYVKPGSYSYPYNFLTILCLLLASVFQFSLAKGYFNFEGDR